MIVIGLYSHQSQFFFFFLNNSIIEDREFELLMLSLETSKGVINHNLLVQ
jgi:hypothetical protein